MFRNVGSSRPVRRRLIPKQREPPKKSFVLLFFCVRFYRSKLSIFCVPVSELWCFCVPLCCYTNSHFSMCYFVRVILCVPVVQCHIAVCYCVRSRVSAGTSLYGVMSAYASMCAVLVLCACKSHISICVQEHLCLCAVFVLLYSCVYVLSRVPFCI
jgi:hypothetical protein